MANDMLLFWYVSLSSSLWTLLYVIITKLNHRKSAEWNCRIIAMTHAIVATKLVELSVVFGEQPFYSIGEQNSDIQNFILVNSAGYFVFDFIWCVYMGTEGMMMLMHHVISILSLIGGLVINHSGSEISVTLAGSELTNPFLQTRWFLKESKLYDTTFGKINDFVFFGLFLFTRVGIGSGLAYLIFFSQKTILVIKIGGFTFFLISVIWAWQIWKFIKRKYFSIKVILKRKNSNSES